MAVDMSFVTKNLIGWFLNPLFWMLILVGIAILLIFILWIRKKRRLIYSASELVDYGQGKFGINSLKCGYYGKKLYFRGLLWKGEEVMRADSGEEIRDFSTEDFQQINGKRGVVCFRCSTNQNILVPITKASFKNDHLLAEIAPASYCDAAIDIFHEGVNETKDWKDKILPIAIIGGVILFALVSIIIISQLVKNGQKEAAELIMQAGTTGIANCKAMCSEIVNVVTSTAP